MTNHADTSPPVTRGAPSVELPETDDPVVLRELLRQAREHLRLRESIELVMAENTARTEALLLESRAASASPRIDPAELAPGLAALRASLAAAMATVDRLGELVAEQAPPGPATPAGNPDDETSPATATPAGARHTTEVLVHEIHNPALARSLQQHLAAIDGVEHAEVRELAEGMLRITVDGTATLDTAALDGWEPDRDRTVLTARPGVLEIELS